MTATPELIVWVALNLIGMVIFSWLAMISWERRIAVIVDKQVLLKGQRLHAATRQMRNRAIGVIAHLCAVFIGAIPMFGIDLPFHGTSWIGILVVGAIILAATFDLYGEFRRS